MKTKLLLSNIFTFFVRDDDNIDGWLQKANEAWVFVAELQNVITTPSLENFKSSGSLQIVALSSCVILHNVPINMLEMGKSGGKLG